MGTVHIATLFLPVTVSFEPETKGPPPPPSPGTLKRNNSALSLTSRVSSLALDLFAAQPKTPTPKADTEEALNTNPFGAQFGAHSRSKSSLALNETRVSRKLLYSDADAPEWGSTAQLYHQPRSRAKPMISKSIYTTRRGFHEPNAEDEFIPKEKPAPKAPSSGGAEYNEWTFQPAIRGNGALLHAVRAARDENRMDVSWVGTLGMPTDEVSESTKLKIADQLGNDKDCEVVYVKDEDFQGHYKNFCKVVLWPLFHYQVPDDVNSKAYMNDSWKFYKKVNEAFAEQLVASYKRGDTIWIHDYHLLLVPQMVREKLPDAKIGFFLHTAFPSSEIFRCQMKYKEMLQGMLGANLIGFQLKEYAIHFVRACGRFLRVEVTEDGVQSEDRFTNVTSLTMGINAAEIEEVRKGDDFAEAIQELKERFQDKKLLVARDKLDRVHGVRQKLLAYERFLDQNPDRAKDTVLLQIINTSEEQAELCSGINEIQSRIDRNHATLTQTPLVIYHQTITPAQYYAILTVGDVLINSTQRDGVNLTAHEFVFCQDGKIEARCHGPLILSEFAGCYEILKSGVEPINPWSIRQQTEAIVTALSMDPKKKQERWSRLFGIVMDKTGGQWFNELNRMLTEAHQAQTDRSAVSVPRLSMENAIEAYERASSRVFILDYEGTVIARQTSAGAFLTSPTRIAMILEDLIMDPKNAVYVSSGSSHKSLAQIFQTTDGLGLIAENGCWFSYHGDGVRRAWKTNVNQDLAAEWKSDLDTLLSYWQERLPGSILEEMDCSIALRFDAVEKETVDRLLGDCADQISSRCEKWAVRVVPTADALLMEQRDVTKATAAINIFNSLQNECAEKSANPPDFVMLAGDDREDEALFQWGNELANDQVVRDMFTVSIGHRNTEAKTSVIKGPATFLGVLEKLAEKSRESRPVKNPAPKRQVGFTLTPP